MNKTKIINRIGKGKMEIKQNSKGLYRLIGAVFLAQAIMPLAGGLLFQSLEKAGDTAVIMRAVAGNLPAVAISIFLWIATEIFVILLGVALFCAVGHIGKTWATFACAMYLLEAVLALTGQVFEFGFVKVSLLYAASGDAGLLGIGGVLLACRHFAGEISMIPFGIGAVIFYAYLMKAEILPKWLAIWGLVTAQLIMIGVPLSTLGVAVPAAVLAPYVPFEFFTGAYLLIRYRKSKDLTTVAAA